ncbi:DNA polymerase II, partial [Alteromonadaceae bacterium A_SAG1]|nr:DNA polymerase II [Alteromonadaceae bacterium A_SAG1]
MYVELWVKTPSSTARLISSPQYPTCFVSVDHANDLRNIAERISAKISVSDDGFHTLEQVPVATIKTATESHMHQLRQHAQESSIILYEADIRVADRYLMERFVYGAVEFLAPQDFDDTPQIVIENAQIRPCQFRTTFTSLSIDIECNEHEELFSIALAGEGLNVVLLLCPPRFVGQTLQGQEDSAYELI